MNYEKHLLKILGQLFVRYNGILIEKTENGFKYRGKEYKDLEEIKKIIDSKTIKVF